MKTRNEKFDVTFRFAAAKTVDGENIIVVYNRTAGTEVGLATTTEHLSAAFDIVDVDDLPDGFRRMSAEEYRAAIVAGDEAYRQHQRIQAKNYAAAASQQSAIGFDGSINVTDCI